MSLNLQSQSEINTMRFLTLASLTFVLPALALAAEIPKAGSLLLSKHADGTIANSPSERVAISANGKRVSNASLASNLGTGTFNGFMQVFLYKRSGNPLGVASKTVLGGSANLDCGASKLSLNGRYIAFESRSSMLVDGVIGGTTQVFRRDMETGEVVLASVKSSGAQVDEHTQVLDMSDDGRFIVFESHTNDVVAGVTTKISRAYVRDVELGTTVLASRNDADVPLTNATYNALISANGRFVFFSSASPELDGIGKVGTYVRDLKKGTTTTLSRNYLGEVANGDTMLLGVSPNARFVVMESEATNLTSLKEGGIVVLDRTNGTVKPIDVSEPNMPITGVGSVAVISNDGARLWVQVAYDGGIFFGKKVDLIEIDRAKKKRWTRISVGGQELMGGQMEIDGSATAEWLAVITDEKITDSTGTIDSNNQRDLYLLRSH